MIDSTQAERQVALLARVRDEDLDGLESTTAARTLLASLMAGPVNPVRPDDPAPRRWLARGLVPSVAVVVAVTLAAVVAPSLLKDGPGGATSYANSAIDIRREGNFFVARIKDPLADHAKYIEAFRAVGKDVDIELVPVSPGRVGQLLQAGGDGGHTEVSTELVSSGPEPVDCALKPSACTMVIRISVDTTGAVRYKLGRVARPGETYQDPVREAPGSPVPNTASTRSAGGQGN